MIHPMNMNNSTNIGHENSTTSILGTGRLRNNSTDFCSNPATSKRLRAGSISGRLRAASDLEEHGYIDKYQKGLIKDLIISGDEALQRMLDKYEKGDTEELINFVRSGFLGRSQSIDLIDGLDFDFLNAFQDDDDDKFASNLKSSGNTLFGNGSGQQAAATNNGALNPVDFAWQEMLGHSTRTGEDNKESQPLLLNNNNGTQRRTRRESLDSLLLLNDLDDFVTDHTAVEALAQGGVYNELFEHFAQTDYNSNGNSAEESHQTSASNSTKRKSIRYSLNSGHAEAAAASAAVEQSTYGSPVAERDVPPGSGVELSAYANLAASLQQQQQFSLQKNSPFHNGTTLNTKPTSPAQQLFGVENNMNTTNSYNSGGINTAGLSGAGLLDRRTSKPHIPAALLPGTNKSLGATSSGLRPITSTTLYSSHHHMVAPAIDPKTREVITASTRPPGYIGAYSPEQRRQRIEKFLEKRQRRVWTKKVKYDVRKNFADSRMRIKGRFVRKEDEDVMRELLNI